MKRMARLLLTVSVLALLLAPVMALAGPRSGGSFSGRGGFRSGGGSYSRGPARAPGGSYSRGPNVVIFPGWGFLPFMGGGGGVGGLLMLGALGLGAVMLLRAVRRGRSAAQPGGLGLFGGGEHDDDAEAALGSAHVYRIQLGIGRSARGIQQRLEQFAAEGDTASEAGLAHLLSQTALELMREKDAIRYAAVDASGPLSLTNGETKLNGLALQERSRFQVERVRGADGSVRRSNASGARTDEVLEYLMVTILVATRSPLPQVARIHKAGAKSAMDHAQLDAVLAELGGVAPAGLLGLEVIWTPADPDDALTEAEMVLLYPDLRMI